MQEHRSGSAVPQFRRCRRLAAFATLPLLLAVLIPPGSAQPPPPALADPIGNFAAILKNDRDLGDRSKALAEAAARLRTAADFSRALLLQGWRTDPADLRIREDLLSRFGALAKDALESGNPDRQMAVLVLLGETAREARRQPGQAQRLSAVIRSRLTSAVVHVVEHSSGNVRLVALQNLGLINPELNQAIPAIQKYVKAPDRDLRRVATAALGSLVQVLAYETTVRLVQGEWVLDLLEAGERVVAVAADILNGNEPDPLVRRFAVSAIRTTAERFKELAPRIYEPIFRTTQPAEEDLIRERQRKEQRDRFRKLMEVFESRPVVNALLRGVQDPQDPQIRIEALQAIEFLADTRRTRNIPVPLPGQGVPPPPRPGTEEVRQPAEPARLLLPPMPLPAKSPTSTFSPPDRQEAPPANVPAELAPSAPDLPLPQPVAVPQRGAQTEASGIKPIVALLRPVKLAPDEGPALQESQPKPPEAPQKLPESQPKPPDAPPAEPELGTLLKQQFVQGGAIQVLAGRLRDPDPRVRRATLDVLEALGEPSAAALPQIIAALRDPDGFVRWSTARVLGRLAPYDKAGRAVPGLICVINDPDLDIEQEAIHSLELYGPVAAAAVPMLAAVIGQSTDLDLRTHAMLALIMIGPAAQPALKEVARALLDLNPRVRRAAAETMGRFGTLARPYVPQLRQALWDIDPDVRRAASEALVEVLRPTPLER